MKIVASKRFAKSYRCLSSQLQEQIEKTVHLLAAKNLGKPFHPSLRAKRVQGTTDIWEASVTMQHRLTFQIYQDTLYLRVVGDHDATLKRP